jgi:hypothetical protein
MTTVPTVSPTELIRSSWGNTVATELNTKTVKVDGSMPMTGPLIINASPGLRLRRTGDAPYLQFENTTGATRFGYVQGAANRLTYAVDGAAGVHQFTRRRRRTVQDRQHRSASRRPASTSPAARSASAATAPSCP